MRGSEVSTSVVKFSEGLGNSLLLICIFRLSHSFIFFLLHFLSFYIWLYVLCAAVELCKLCNFIVMFMYSY
jgi:hypothetical protein